MAHAPEWFGFFNVDKPAGWTSRKVVDHVKRLVRPAKVGHAGTLDPLAEGVLIVCVGPATRLVPFLHELPKCYRGEFLLGKTSDTADVEGEVREAPDAPVPTREEVLAILPQFIGRITQTPPVFSAAKIKGRRAYDLARRGQAPDIPPREVDVHRLELVEFAPPRFVLDIECGTGTYVRSLGRDVARSLGTDAVMSGLVRTRIGPFEQSAAVAPDDVTPASIDSLLIPAADGVPQLTTIVGDDPLLERMRHGLAVDCPDSVKLHDGQRCAIVDASGRLAAIGEYSAENSRIAPRHVFL